MWTYSGTYATFGFQLLAAKAGILPALHRGSIRPFNPEASGSNLDTPEIFRQCSEETWNFEWRALLNPNNNGYICQQHPIQGLVTGPQEIHFSLVSWVVCQTNCDAF